MALPIILCGQSSQIAMGVKNGLLPECDVIHTILTPAQGATEIPLILQGQTPPAAAEPNVGSGNYSKAPVAVIMGRGYDDAAFKLIFDAAEEKGVAKKLPWLRPDMGVQTPPLGPEYGKHMVGRVKAAMGKLVEEGKLGEECEWGVVMY